MKKILFLLLVSFSPLKTMEQSSAFTSWDELATELQQYILEFMPDNVKDLANLKLVSTKFRDQVSNHHFLSNCAKRIHEHDPGKLNKLLQATLYTKHAAFATIFINADDSIKRWAEKKLHKALRINPNWEDSAVFSYHLNNRLELIKTLLQADINVNAQRARSAWDEPRTPLMRACMWLRRIRNSEFLDAVNDFHEKVIKLLLEHGADAGQEGALALNSIAWFNNTALTKLLLENRAKLRITNEEILKLQEFLRVNNRTEMVELLENFVKEDTQDNSF